MRAKWRAKWTPDQRSAHPSIVCLAALVLISLGLSAVVAAQEPHPATDYPKSVDPWEVIIYEHPGFTGAWLRYQIEPGMRQRLVPQIARDFEDKVRSIQVGSAVEVVLMAGRDFYAGAASDRRHVRASWVNVQIGFRVSSLIVYPKVYGGPLGVWVADERSGSGLREVTFFPLPELKSETEQGWSFLGHCNLDRNANRVWVDSLATNVELVLYDQPDFRGTVLTLPSVVGWARVVTGMGAYFRVTEYNLGPFGWSDRAASLRVRLKGPDAAGPSSQPMTVKVILPPSQPSSVPVPPVAPSKAPSTPNADIAGQWVSNTGAVYTITWSTALKKDGGQFTWAREQTSETGTGSVQGNEISAGLEKGVAVVTSPGGVATRIEWGNGLILTRQSPALSDIAGTWQSTIGLQYEITQKGDEFVWFIPSTKQTGYGTVTEQAITAKWMDAAGSWSITGKVTQRDVQGRPIRIEWSNGVIIFR